jgi:tryptophan-rich sensory protein
MDTDTALPGDPRLRTALSVLGWVLLAQLAGLVGSVATASSVNGWYTTLVRPELAPPGWVFAPVWTTLFTLMGVAAFLAWRAEGTRWPAFVAFGGQLLLNVAWSFVFFGAQAIGPALAVIAVLWIAILLNAVLFARLDRRAGLLLVPYLAWVAFAAYLNYGFWMLN